MTMPTTMPMIPTAMMGTPTMTPKSNHHVEWLAAIESLAAKKGTTPTTMWPSLINLDFLSTAADTSIPIVPQYPAQSSIYCLGMAGELFVKGFRRCFLEAGKHVSVRAGDAQGPDPGRLQET